MEVGTDVTSWKFDTTSEPVEPDDPENPDNPPSEWENPDGDVTVTPGEGDEGGIGDVEWESLSKRARAVGDRRAAKLTIKAGFVLENIWFFNCELIDRTDTKNEDGTTTVRVEVELTSTRKATIQGITKAAEKTDAAVTITDANLTVDPATVKLNETLDKITLGLKDGVAESVKLPAAGKKGVQSVTMGGVEVDFSWDDKGGVILFNPALTVTGDIKITAKSVDDAKGAVVVDGTGLKLGESSFKTETGEYVVDKKANDGYLMGNETIQLVLADDVNTDFYQLPETVEVKVGTAKLFSMQYKYDKETGVITITDKGIKSGDITIIASAASKSGTVSISLKKATGDDANDTIEIVEPANKTVAQNIPLSEVTIVLRAKAAADVLPDSSTISVTCGGIPVSIVVSEGEDAEGNPTYILTFKSSLLASGNIVVKAGVCGTTTGLADAKAAAKKALTDYCNMKAENASVGSWFTDEGVAANNTGVDTKALAGEGSSQKILGYDAAMALLNTRREAINKMIDEAATKEEVESIITGNYSGTTLTGVTVGAKGSYQGADMTYADGTFDKASPMAATFGPSGNIGQSISTAYTILQMQEYKLSKLDTIFSGKTGSDYQAVKDWATNEIVNAYTTYIEGYSAIEDSLTVDGVKTSMRHDAEIVYTNIALKTIMTKTIAKVLLLNYVKFCEEGGAYFSSYYTADWDLKDAANKTWPSDPNAAAISLENISNMNMGMYQNALSTVEARIDAAMAMIDEAPTAAKVREVIWKGEGTNADSVPTGDNETRGKGFMLKRENYPDGTSAGPDLEMIEKFGYTGNILNSIYSEYQILAVKMRAVKTISQFGNTDVIANAVQRVIDVTWSDRDKNFWVSSQDTADNPQAWDSFEAQNTYLSVYDIVVQAAQNCDLKVHVPGTTHENNSCDCAVRLDNGIFVHSSEIASPSPSALFADYSDTNIYG